MVRKLPQFISREDFDKLMKHCAEVKELYWRKNLKKYTPYGYSVHSYMVCMLLAYGAGMRISEIVGLENKDKTLKIKPLQPIQIEEKCIRVIGGKGGKDRLVPWPSKLIVRYDYTRDEIISMLPLATKRRALQKFFNEICIKVLKKKYSIHKLRHGFATNMLAQGMDLRNIQMLMGHENMNTTAIYMHADPQEAIKKAQEMEW